MSYEGYERRLCRNGHLDEDDCYSSSFLEPTWRCRHCGEPLTWWESVDQTNNGGIETALRPYSRHECCCPICGNLHAAKTPQYYIPDDGRTTKAAPLVPLARCGFQVLETSEVFDTQDQAAARLEQLEEEREQEHQRSLKELGLA